MELSGSLTSRGPRPKGGGSRTPRVNASSRFGSGNAATFASPRASWHEIPPGEIERIVHAALEEDLGAGDATTEATIDADATCSAQILLKEPGVVSGLPVAEAVFLSVDCDVAFEVLVDDGEAVDPGPIASVSGSARAVLAAERTALNLLGRMCGIATLTRRFVDAVADTGATILDTRKTTPGLRVLEKYAVRCGGGTNHRLALDDAILIKDNHLRLAGGIDQAVAAARGSHPDLPLEVEAETVNDVHEALAADADAILLDNMRPAEIAEAVALVGGRARLEASGGVTLENVRELAATGVDSISVGALTHSARALDVSLEVR
jgi:nicotinate-nucleotide pyrophosphorylase (carboxylating)